MMPLVRCFLIFEYKGGKLLLVLLFQAGESLKDEVRFRLAKSKGREVPDRHKIHVNMTVRALRFPSGRGDRPYGTLVIFIL